MGKRLISLMLAVILLMLSGVTDALAAATARSYLSELQRIGYIDTLCGFNSNAAPYRAGMSVRGANAGQMLTALQNLMENDISPSLHQLEEAMVAQTAVGTARSAASEHEVVRSMRDDARQLYYEVEAYYDSIAMHRRVIQQETEALNSGAYDRIMDAEQAAYRVLMSLNDLQQLMGEAEERFSPSLRGDQAEDLLSWTQRANVLKDFINVDHDCCDDKPMLAAQQMMVKARTSYMDSLMAQAHQMSAEENNARSVHASDDAHIEVYIMTSDEVAIEVVNDAHQPLENAVITMWPADEPTHRHTGRYEPQGRSVMFDLHDFHPDQTRTVEVGYEIVCDGYQMHYVERMLLVGGTQYPAVMQPLSDPEQVYVAGASINGEDMMWHAYNVYITPKNDANQTITAYLAKGSSGMPGSGTVSMCYSSTTAVQTSVEAAYSPRADLDLAAASFVDQWCRILAYGDSAVSFEVKAASNGLQAGQGSTASTRLTALKAARPSATIDPDDRDMLTRLLATDLFTVTFDKDLLVIGGTMVSVKMPKIPIGVYVGADGTQVMAITYNNDMAARFEGLQSDSNLWKTQDQRRLDRAIAAYAEQMGKEASEVSEDFMNKHGQDYRYAWLGKCNAMWCVNGAVITKPYYDENKEYIYSDGSFNVGFMFGATGDFSQNVYLSPPVRTQITFKAALGFSLQLPFRAYGSVEPGQSQFKFRSPSLSLLIKVMGSVSVGLCFEAKGFNLFSMGLSSSIFLAFKIPLIYEHDFKDDFSMVFDATVSIYISSLVFNANVFLTKFNWSYAMGEPKLTGYIIFVGWLPKDKAALALADEPLPDDTLDSNEVDLRGSTLWHYDNIEYGLDSMPVSVELYEDYHPYQGVESTVYTFWLNGKKVMVSRNGMSDPREFVLPDNGTPAYNEALTKLRSGEYTPVDLTVSPYASTTCVEMQGFDQYGYHDRLYVNAAVLTLLYAKTWTEKEQIDPADPDGAARLIRVPESTGALMLILHHKPGVHELPTVMDVVDYLTPPESAPVPLYAAAYCVDIPELPAMDQLIAYPFNAAMVQRAVGVKDACLVQHRQAYQSSILAYMLLADAKGEGHTASYFRIGMDGRHHEQPTAIAKGVSGMITGLTYGSSPFYLLLNGAHQLTIGTMDDAQIVGHQGGTAAEFTDFTISEDFRTYDYQDRLTIFALKEPANDQDPCALFNVTLRMSDSELHELKVTAEKTSDYNLQIRPSKLYCDRLLGEYFDDVVYWYETGEAGKAQPDRAGQSVTRIRGMYYQRSTQALSADFVVATLDGDDHLPASLTAMQTPLKSDLLGSRLFIARALAPADQPEDETYMGSGEDAYMFTAAESFSHVNLDILGAVIDHHTITKGTSAKLDFTLANTGNLPILRFTLGVYCQDAQGQRRLLTSYLVDCTNDQASLAKTLTASGDMQTERTGIAAVHRETNHFSGMNRNMWHYPQGSAPAATLLTTPLGDWGSSDAVFLKALMPESAYSYSASLGFPEDFARGYDIYIHVDSVEVPRKFNNLLGSTADQLLTADELLTIDLTGSNDVLLSLNDLSAGDVAAPNVITPDIPLRASTTPITRLSITNAQIEADHQLFMRDGEQYAAIAIAQRGDTPASGMLGSVVVRAYVNEETAPSFIHRFRNHTSDAFAFNLTLPVRTLSGGRSARYIRVVVSDEAEGNVDGTTINNVMMIYPEPDQPDPSIYVTVTAAEAVNVVKEGEPASFTAFVVTNAPSYTYQWQSCIDGQWVDLPGRTGDLLYFAKCDRSMDGRQYRCVVSTSTGHQAVSNTVQLRIQMNIPVTGDATPLGWLIAGLIGSLMIMLMLMQKRRWLSRQ